MSPASATRLLPLSCFSSANDSTHVRFTSDGATIALDSANPADAVDCSRSLDVERMSPLSNTQTSQSSQAKATGDHTAHDDDQYVGASSVGPRCRLALAEVVATPLRTPRPSPRERQVAPPIPFVDDTILVQVGPRGAWKRACLAVVREWTIDSTNQQASDKVLHSVHSDDLRPPGIAPEVDDLVFQLYIAVASNSLGGSRLRLLLRAPAVAVALRLLSSGHEIDTTARDDDAAPTCANERKRGSRFSILLRPPPCVDSATPCRTMWRPVQDVLILTSMGITPFASRLAASHVEWLPPE